MSEEEVINNHVKIIGELESLLELQISQLRRVATTFSNKDINESGNAFSYLFIIETLKHFRDQSKFFCRQILHDKNESFFLMPVLRAHLEMFTTLMYIRSISDVDRAKILLNENFIRLALIYKKNKINEWEDQYSKQYELHKNLISEYSLEIPNRVVDFTRKKIDNVTDRLPDLTDIYDSLQSIISDLETRKLFPAKGLNQIYSALCLYSHGNALFISRLGREDLWVISMDIYLGLFLCEMIEKDFLNNVNQKIFEKIYNDTSENKKDLTSIWKTRSSASV